MFKNVYHDKYTDDVHLWYTDGQKNKYKVEKWIPYLFRKDVNGDVKTICSDIASKIKFKSYSEYKDFQKNNKKDIFENHCNTEIQYLVEKYYKINDDKIVPPKLKVYSLDIEVNVRNKLDSTGTFPTPDKAELPITLITIYDFNNDHYYTFGLHEYKVTQDNVTYIYCKDNEQLLLKRFFSFTHKYPPDVYTGWNISLNKKMVISGFDFPYIINRTKKLFGNDTNLYKLLSPIKKVRAWKSNDDISVSIAGVSILDYIALYKWYTQNNLEKYTLDFVCNFELGETKLDFDGSLNDLYFDDWQKYVDYNIRDTYLIKKLNDKLGYIELVQTLSLVSRAPMENFMAMTQLLEGKLLTYYRRHNLCAPCFAGGIQEKYPGGYVKDPKVGLHDWVVSVDIASSYPTAIITLNMSNETYLGIIEGLTEDEIIYYTSKREFPLFMLNKKGETKKISGKQLTSFNTMLERSLISIAPCGTCFRTDKKGVIAEMEHEMFIKRKQVKKDMKLLYDVEGKQDEIKRKNVYQQALKILLNSMYGITAVPYSRYFCVDIARAITSCARHTIRQGEKYVNELLNGEIENQELTDIINELKE